MAKKEKKATDSPQKIRPALTPEAEENQMISLAMNLAKQQLLDGTASSQVISHFLRLGSSKEKQEIENLKKDIELKQAKIEALETGRQIEELYGNAIKAMRRYQGVPSDE